MLVAHVWLSHACLKKQVGDHVSVWYTRGSGLRQGWYDGKVEAVRPRENKNVSVWFPDGVDRLRFVASGYGVRKNWVLQDVLDNCGNEACCGP